MTFLHRMRNAIPVSLLHLVCSLIVGVVCALLIFFVWYPYPYNKLVGGQELFTLIVVVDVICGPLLTLIVFDSYKSKRELLRDMGVIVVIQLSALLYGISSLYSARPVFLAFEGSLFRVVRVPDIDFSQMNKALPELQRLSLTGPRLIGVVLAKGNDSDFVKSIQLSLEGLHPAFRPARWVNYDVQRPTVISESKPLSLLQEKYLHQRKLIDESLAGKNINEFGYLPLMAASHTDWVVIVSLEDAQPIAFLPLDPW